MSCSTSTIVSPRPESVRKASTRRAFSPARKPAAGSSSSSTEGRCASARAMASRRSCPSGSTAAGSSARPVQPDDREGLASLLSHPLLFAPLPWRPKHVLDEARTGANVSSDGGVVEHVELGEWARRLEHRRQPVPGAAMRRPARDVAPVDANDAAVDEVEPRDAAEEGRLSGAVRADQARQRAGSNVERDVVDRPDRTERLRDARELASDLRLRLGCERKRGRRHVFRLPETRVVLLLIREAAAEIADCRLDHVEERRTVLLREAREHRVLELARPPRRRQRARDGPSP